jgi:hypothetical protein
MYGTAKKARRRISPNSMLGFCIGFRGMGAFGGIYETSPTFGSGCVHRSVGRNLHVGMATGILWLYRYDYPKSNNGESEKGKEEGYTMIRRGSQSNKADHGYK